MRTFGGTGGGRARSLLPAGFNDDASRPRPEPEPVCEIVLGVDVAAAAGAGEGVGAGAGVGSTGVGAAAAGVGMGELSEGCMEEMAVARLINAMRASSFSLASFCCDLFTSSRYSISVSTTAGKE